MTRSTSRGITAPQLRWLAELAAVVCRGPVFAPARSAGKGGYPQYVNSQIPVHCGRKRTTEASRRDHRGEKREKQRGTILLVSAACSQCDNDAGCKARTGTTVSGQRQRYPPASGWLPASRSGEGTLGAISRCQTYLLHPERSPSNGFASGVLSALWPDSVVLEAAALLLTHDLDYYDGVLPCSVQSPGITWRK